ncbi:hypothetical protein [Onishia taeanensis]|nr:hypothetical protein [Halomonas taeanensis]
MKLKMAETPQYYAEDAYTPDRLRRRLEGECQHSRKFRTFAAGGERLAHRNPSVDISPMHEWQHNSPQKLREYEADPTVAKLKDPEYRVDQPLRWDEECIRFTSHTKRAFIFGMARAFGLCHCFLLVLLFSLPSMLTMLGMGVG